MLAQRQGRGEASIAQNFPLPAGSRDAPSAAPGRCAKLLAPLGEHIMASLVTLTFSQPTRSLAAGEVLVHEGDPGGDLYVLESGKLIVERDGINIASISEPGALVGEMSVLTGRKNSATVKADGKATVRVIKDAMRYFGHQPEVAVHDASVLAKRLDATSALLVELKGGPASHAEQSLVNRLMAVVMGHH